MGCKHRKERFSKWCRACGEAKAGPKPKLAWKHGDVAIRLSGEYEGDSYKVLDSELTLYGLATDEPVWREDLFLRDLVNGVPSGSVGRGTAELYAKKRGERATVKR